MDGLHVPLLPSSHFAGGAACTPTNGILYICGNIFCYIGLPADGNSPPDIKFAQTSSLLKYIACDPDWSQTKYFALFDEKNIISVWDLNQKVIVCGHHHHAKAPFDYNGGSMCFLKNRMLLSNTRDVFIKYCIASNTYNSFNISSTFNKNSITVMKQNPYNENILVAGTQNGLLVVINMKAKNIIYNLRGHDKTITSIDFMLYDMCNANPAPSTPAAANRPKIRAKNSEQKRRGKPKPIIDSNDVFDIYEFDDLAEEFGAATRSSFNNVPDCKRVEIPNHAEFDFMEACQNLKEDILATKNIESLNETVEECAILSDQAGCSTTDSIIEMDKDLYQHSDAGSTSDGSYVNINETALNSTFNDTALTINEQPIEPFVLLATRTTESFIWIWNIETGAAIHKVELKQPSMKMAKRNYYPYVCWINQRALISNLTNEELVLHDLLLTGNDMMTSKVKITSRKVAGTLIFKCATDPIIWVNASNKWLCFRVTDDLEQIVTYSTAMLNVTSIKESPHDFNKIAFGGTGNRFNIINLSNLSGNAVEFTSHKVKIQSTILYLAWHPVRENQLAFSTVEGRVGVYDITSKNAPIIMKPFTGKAVYQLTWAPTDESGDRYNLLACSNGQLVSFDENGKVTRLAEDIKVSAVNAGNKYITLGSISGVVYIYKFNLKECIWSQKITEKYISECAWSNVTKTKLAASCSDSGITLLECLNDSEVSSVGKLVGHKGVTYIKWSNEYDNKLVSTGFDGTIRVWDTTSLTCISLYQNDFIMNSAIFMPTDENYVICCGLRDSLHIFDTRIHMHASLNTMPKRINYAANMKMAKYVQTDTQILIAEEKKNNKKVEKRSLQVQEARKVESDAGLSESLGDMNLNREPTQTVGLPLKYNYSTICFLTNKEFNKNTLQTFKCILTNDPDETVPLNKQLFSTKEDVRDLLNNELQNHKSSVTDSVATCLIPQLNMNIEEELLAKVSSKTLNERDLAIAPMVSYGFWKQCCSAYAKQNIDLGCPLMAIPYLLASQEINQAITTLCDSDYYREAWIIAKLNKEPEDVIFTTISDKWISGLESVGQLDGAALIAAAVNKNQAAYDLLAKRKNRTAEVDDILQLLQAKVNK